MKSKPTDAWALKRTLEPETDSVRFTVEYTASIEGVMTFDAALDGGNAAAHALINELHEALAHQILLDMQVLEVDPEL